VEESVRALRETGAAGVGGRYLHEGRDGVSNAIGLAMVSPFGMASPHRFARKRQEVDTISHPAYVRAEMLATGPFDEELLRNSDYEFNWRMRARGSALVFDPSIVSVYRPRASLDRMARQFWWYGRWKVRVIRRHRQSFRVRHAVPPVALFGLLCAPVLLFWPAGRKLVGASVAAYALADMVATAAAKPAEHDANPVALFACFPVLHASWAAGFLTSLIEEVIPKQ
jgi:hypothetical protein